MLAGKKLIAVFLVLVIVIGITGAIVWQQLVKPGEAITGSVTIVDDLGRNVTITTYPPERIVSLAPSSTEILFALGLGSKVVGVDTYSDYPPQVNERVKAGNLTTVGSFASISIETVVGLNPDLVLAEGGVQKQVAEKLGELGLPVLVLWPYPIGFSGVPADISLVGKATGQTDKAEALVTDINRKSQEIADKTQNATRPSVYVEYYFNGGYWSYGSDSYVNELIFKAGGINVFAGFAPAYITTSSEEVIKANPEIIVITKGAMSEAAGLTPDVIRKRAGWDGITAIKNNRIFEVDESPLTRPGPRMIDALETLARLLHPELFS